MAACSLTRNYNPNKKFAPEALREDYSLLRDILEAKHPSLYWYTPRDSMNKVFNEGFQSISDSMTELLFGWKILAPLTSAIHCGHTSFLMSKDWNRFIRNKKIPSFPLFVKVWKDSMMVVANLNDPDSGIKRGHFITAINGISVSDMAPHMMQYMVSDGYSENFSYLRLSVSFPYFHRNIYGLYKKYRVDYTDSNGLAYTKIIPWFMPVQDSAKEKKEKKEKHRARWSKKERRLFSRSLQIDSSYALMTVNTFLKGKLLPFFRKSFRTLEEKNIPNLIIDLRVNGGGDINKSVQLARYMRKEPFHVSDSAFSKSKNFTPYSKYIRHSFWNNIGLLFLSKKEKDGKYHFGYWEKRCFRPRQRHHYDGNIYILTNGYTFSAASYFCGLMKGQGNVVLVGEETGGGWYGNSGVMIPNITLPNTGLRVRLPFFRMVQYCHLPVKGSGVLPDWYIGPNWRDILEGRDTKMEAVVNRITDGED